MSTFLVIVIIFVLVVIVSALFATQSAKQSVEKFNTVKDKLSNIEGFSPTKTIYGANLNYIFAIDEDNQQIAIINENSNNIADFDEIIGVEILEDGNTILKKSTTRTVGGAIIGGVLAGGVGSIVGGLSGSSKEKKNVSNLSVKILLRDLARTSFLITCFDSRTMTTERKSSISTEGNMESWRYQQAKENAVEIKDLISIIINRVDNEIKGSKQEVSTSMSASIADELKKLYDLKEKGILSDEEFTVQKQKLLS